jgi:hypothetical protein
MKTDLLVGDGHEYYGVQIKSLETDDEDHIVVNKWGNAAIDFVIYFYRSGNLGYITPSFEQKRKRLNSPGRIRFHKHPKPFLKALDLA